MFEVKNENVYNFWRDFVFGIIAVGTALSSKGKSGTVDDRDGSSDVAFGIRFWRGKLSVFFDRRNLFRRSHSLHRKSFEERG